jgi:hypothetical protein
MAAVKPVFTGYPPPGAVFAWMCYEVVDHQKLAGTAGETEEAGHDQMARVKIAYEQWEILGRIGCARRHRRGGLFRTSVLES